MAKIKTRFVCNNCGSVSTRWLGRCPQCGEWNTLVEEQTVPQAPKGVASSVRSEGTEPELLKSVRMESMSVCKRELTNWIRFWAVALYPGS